MILDLTKTWRAHPYVGGIYVVRSTKSGSQDVLRIGAGGNRRGKTGVKGRLLRHRSRPPENVLYGSHVHQPFATVLRVWGLVGWSPAEIEDGEHCLYHPFLIRFPRLVDYKSDKSLFVVSPNEDLSVIFEMVEKDLRTMESLRTEAR